MATWSTTVSTNSQVRKLALVIGISDYADGQKLPNAINDAKDITSSLKRMGFIIDEPKLNLDNKQMQLVLTEFQYSVEKGDIVLFYFAGHGTQWEVCIIKYIF